ncbi:MAG: helix-turn-helix domain-containing protein, partial [Candidatus Peribacteraceae bacterium]|nr:helix-turn-helix domain-containing protein [Candidatus Peribacteraceae bacterium]
MIPELQVIGFTRNEANVYLAALKLGTCSVQQLAQITGLNRITVHSITEKFESLQLFTRSYEGKRRRVSAAGPEQLDILLRRQEQETAEKKRALQSLLPSLNDLFLSTQRGLQVHTFQGEKGYEQMCEDILTSKTETLEYANIDALNAVIAPYIASEYL